jgi:NAD(P)-dependent dehydrogenase (short-subunit alcohol dehydrogenase family)
MARHGRPVVTIPADLADPADRSRVVPEAVAGLGGPVEILVNNAAAAIYAPIEDYPLRRRQITFEVNVHAPVDLIQAVLPAMVERGEGWIVNLSSSTARLLDGPPFAAPPIWSTMAVYGASKAALNRLTNGLGEALSGTGVRVNAVQPRKGVASEGAQQLVGGLVDQSEWETMDEMIDAVLALCDCGPDWTGRVWASDEVRAAWGDSLA